eukprot:4376881-Pleurochrysis_carterae.AAC.1
MASLNALLNKRTDVQRRVIETFHSDNAGEFLSSEFTEYLATSGVHNTTCPPHVHQLNGVAKRAIRSIMEPTRSSLAFIVVPPLLSGTTPSRTPSTS